MPGYSLASSEKEFDAKYLCSICGLLLREAVQNGACGHLYCESCLGSRFSNGNSKCVKDTCQEKLVKELIFPDNFIRREVAAFVVSCTFLDDGCRWKGKVKHLEVHTNSCEHNKLPCVHPKCGMLVKKSDLLEHLEKTCKCRLETCRFCKKQVSLNIMKLHHERECPAYRVVCEKCNKYRVPRSKLCLHQDPVIGDCDAVHGPCPFVQSGFSKTELLNHRQRKEHLDKESTYHSTLPLHQGPQMEALLTRDPRIMSTSPRIDASYDLLTQIQSATTENKRLWEKLREQHERITFLERNLAPFAHVLRDTANSVPNNDITRRVGINENRIADHEALLAEVERANLETNSRVDFIERTLALKRVTLANLEERIKQQKFSSYDGQLLWKITEFARRRNEAVSGQQVSFYSPCFYTSRKGYKMCVRIYLNGDGMGRGSHISLFFIIMRGEFDAILPWPFRHKVTFMLLDQDNLAEHVIDAFRPDPNSSSFQRPRRETNIASGFPMFCSLTELNTHAYVRDDTMFINIIVDTTD